MKIKVLSLVAPLVVLAGCGAVNNAINSQIPPVNNAFGLETKSIKITVPTRSRALVVATGSVTGTFGDASIPNLNLVGSVKLQLAFGPTVKVTVPSGASLPASFSLTNVQAGVKVSDASNLVDVTGNATGTTLTFNRVGGTSDYQLASGSTIQIADINVSSVNALMNLMTTGGTNTVVAGFQATVDDTVLPTGSTITFSCTNGDAKLGV